MRPVLRPGTHVLHRGPDEIQLGLDPHHALVITASDDVRTTLSSLSGGTPTVAGDPLLLVLDGHGLVMDERAMRPPGRSPGSAHVLAALARRLGDAAGDAHAARATTRVRTATFGHPLGEQMRAELSALLSAGGLVAGNPSQEHAMVAALVGVGEPDRGLLDAWVRQGTPHVLVRMTEGHATVGPFVVPGRTACLRCIDAHCTDADSAWPLLVAQYARASSRDRADGAAEPVDPLLSTLALAWAARDLATYVDGGCPSTWSSTVVLDDALHRVETRAWLRHPACGCSWV